MLVSLKQILSLHRRNRSHWAERFLKGRQKSNNWRSRTRGSEMGREMNQKQHTHTHKNVKCLMKESWQADGHWLVKIRWTRQRGKVFKQRECNICVICMQLFVCFFLLLFFFFFFSFCFPSLFVSTLVCVRFDLCLFLFFCFCLFSSGLFD